MRGFEPVVGVYFYNPALGDAWLEKLGRLSSIEELSLNNTKLSDDGLKYLAGLSKLKLLFLSGTQIGDGGLKYLTGLSNLRWLSLDNTRVSGDGLKKLQQTLPDCRISRMSHPGNGSRVLTASSPRVPTTRH